MSLSKGAVAIEMRPYRDDDEPAVLSLLGRSLGAGPAGERPASFFRWKHIDNHFGRSFVLVAEHEGAVVGLRAFMRWRFTTGGATLRAVRAVDTATDPAYQGRGIFSMLTRAALDELRGTDDLVFNTPNGKSLPGYLKMGWRIVGRVPIAVRVRRPLRFARRWRSVRSSAPGAAAPAGGLPRVGDVLRDTAAVESLLADAPVGRISTPRDLAYLRWRYERAPLLDYRAVPFEHGGRLAGLAILRVRTRGTLTEATVAELLSPDDDRAARGLLRSVARAVSVDHLTCHASPGTTVGRAAGRAGYWRAPGGLTLVTNPLRDGIAPDPTQLSSWSLSLGDLEVF